MSPDPLVVTRWLAEDEESEIVLYDNGSLRLHAPKLGLDLEIASPWKKSEPPPSGPANESEH
jgi:hypothetical protein